MKFGVRQAVAFGVAILGIGGAFAVHQSGLGTNLLAVILATTLPLAIAIAGGRRCRLRCRGGDDYSAYLPWLGLL